MKPSITWAENLIKKIFVLLFWLGLWQILALKIGKEVLLASPAATMQALVSLVGESAFWHTIAFSIVRIATGFVLGITAGLVLAALSARLERIRMLLSPFLYAVKAAPVASFIILALLWVSGKNLSVFISFLMAMPIVYSNMLQGFMNVDKKLLEMAAVFRMSARNRALYIYLPRVLPYFTAACTTTLGLCWKSGIAAEVIGLPRGSIGDRLYSTKLYLNTPQTFAWTLVIIIISIAAERLFLKILGVVNSKISRGFLARKGGR